MILDWRDAYDYYAAAEGRTAGSDLFWTHVSVQEAELLRQASDLVVAALALGWGAAQDELERRAALS